MIALTHPELIRDHATREELESLVVQLRDELDTLRKLIIMQVMQTTLPVLTADPPLPISNDIAWIVRIGVSPAMDVMLRARVAGATETIATITI